MPRSNIKKMDELFRPKGKSNKIAKLAGFIGSPNKKSRTPRGYTTAQNIEHWTGTLFHTLRNVRPVLTCFGAP